MNNHSTNVSIGNSMAILRLTMFIAGNTVGAGILALPIMLGLVGFYPSCLAIVLLWLIMLASGIIMVKQNVLHKENVDLLTFYELSFGKIGKYIVSICYLFLFYGLCVAYLSGATACILHFIPIELPYYPVLFGVFGLLCFIVLSGNLSLLNSNLVMMFLLFVFFSLIVIDCIPSLKFNHLDYVDWKFIPAVFPVLLCSFGYHNVIPIVVKELKGNNSKIIWTIFLGTLIPLILNFVILFVVSSVLSPIDQEKGSILWAFNNGYPATVPLAAKFGTRISFWGLGFSIFAIFTSYLAVSAGLFGFFKDMLSKSKVKYIPILLTFVVPLIFTLLDKGLFIKAINFAAGLGATIIFGIMPSILLIKKSSVKCKLMGSILFILFASIFLLELGQQLHLFKIIPQCNIR